MWQVVENRLRINECLQYYHHLTLPRNAAVSLLCSFPKQRTSLSISGHWCWFHWPESLTTSALYSGGQPEVARGSVSCLPKEDLLLCSWAWSLPWLPTWKALGSAGKEYVCRSVLLPSCVFSSRNISKTCFATTFGGMGSPTSGKRERRAS